MKVLRPIHGTVVTCGVNLACDWGSEVAVTVT